MRGSTSPGRSAPLTVTVISMLSSRSPRHLGGFGQAAPNEHVDHVPLVLRASPNVAVRLGDLRGQSAGFGERLLAGLGAGQGVLGLGGAEVLRPHRGEGDPRLPDMTVVEL